MSIRKLLFIAGVLAAGFAGGLVVSGRMSLTSPSSALPPIEQSRPAAFPAQPAPNGPLPDLTAVAERAIQASVNISSTQMVQVDPWFQLFYGADSVRPQTSLGSGVIVSADGYVLTNSHVVGNRGAQVSVTLANDRELDARVIGSDQLTDLALLKVEATGLTPLPWGDSSKLRAAEWVLAVGNPFAFSQTVTLGIVSSANRHDPQLATYNDFIQTDAAINPGNSGGALVNARGELVGINSMIYSQTGGYQGIGFAIPINLARQIMTELRNTGEIVRGSIGSLDLQTMNPQLAARARVSANRGVMIRNMYRNEPAYRAGLLPGDVITSVDGKEITEESQLERLVAAAPIGSTVKISYTRGTERRTTDVQIVRMSPPRRRF
jgi:S1-C subfamily serine protease